MNKKFSTLLAAFLVAGGLGSSAFADDLKVKTSEYFQLKDAHDHYLIVGEGAVRDSLALVSKDDFKSLNDLNKTLWRISVETQKDANGFVTGNKYYLENKVNGGVALTYANASEDLSQYYAPGAVVAAGKWEIKPYIDPTDETEVEYSYDSKTGVVTLSSNVLYFGTLENVYDAATKEAVGYKLAEINGIIKLAKGTADASDATSLDDVKDEDPIYHSDFKGDDLAFNAVKFTDKEYALKASWLNNAANSSFALSFNKDVSSSVVNPFSATPLVASTDPLYSAAGYVWGEKVNGEYPDGSYNKALEDANNVVKTLNQIKQDAASYVKELKVALEAELAPEAVSGTDYSVTKIAPNATDVEALSDDLTGAVANFATEEKKNLNTLLKATTGEEAYNYTPVKNPEDETVLYYEVAGAKDKAKKLDENLKAVTDQIDGLVKAINEAITKYDGAVKEFATEIYRPALPVGVKYTVDFSDYKIGDKTPATVLDEQAGKLGSGVKTALETLADAMPEITISEKMTTKGENYALAVVGQADTYLTIDTTYVAEREKYLAVKTIKLNRIGLNAEGSRAEKEADIESYVLVPNVGDLARTAVFKMTVNATTTSGDLITIIANAPKAANTKHEAITGEGGEVISAPVTTPRWFKNYTNEAKYFDVDQHIVIRTLSGVRTVSVTLPGELGTSVENNTKITFVEPDLATLINNGDIFSIKMLSSDEDKDGKYAAVNSISYEVELVKEAYNNVPATQWIVTKNNDNYTFENRDYEAPFLVNQKIFVVDESQMIYSVAADTFQLTKLDVEKEGHLGYKYISEEVQKISEFALSAINYANMETPYYLAFNGNEDSILTATSNKEEALALIPMIKDNKQVTEEYAMNDDNLTKQFYQLIAKDGKDTLYLNIGSSKELVVTKEVPTKENSAYYLQFRSVNDEPNAYEVLLARYNEDYEENGGYITYYKLSYNQDGEAVAVYTSTASAFVYDLVDNSTDIYKNFGFEGSTKVIISLNGDAESKVTKIGPFATVKRTGLDETIDADYSLIMDTAYVDHKDNIRYAYYITKPIVAADTAWNAEKFYMVSYADSLARENDTIKYSQDNLTRIGFVAAKRVGTDSLAITKAVGATAADTLNVTEELGVTNATFAFAIDENNDEAYRIEVAPAKYVSYLNGILVEGAKEQAQLFNVNATDLTPTDNEEISVEAGVQVIGGKGAVTVQGAAGKTVTVYNFQGRALASTTLTSDNQTIAVPAGLVAVSVEGEPEAISVVVK